MKTGKSIVDALIKILEDMENFEKEKATKNESDGCIEVLDRDITLGIRERLCDENCCGITACPLWIGGNCIGNHHLNGVKVKIPARIIDAEAEDRKE